MIPAENRSLIPHVKELLRQWQQEYGLSDRPDGKKHISAAELFAQWDAEDAHLTLEEAEADQRLWAEYEYRQQSLTI